MEFDEHEGQDEEMETTIPLPPGYDSGRARISGGEGGSVTGRKRIRYRECLKNHAVSIGGQAVDGCLEFLAAGEEGTLDALKCAACNCHRNFHRKETDGNGNGRYSNPPHISQFSPFHRPPPPSGYLHLTSPPPHRPLALPAGSGGGGGGGGYGGREEEDVSNPSSSGGGGESRKRFRTRFTAEQKDKMLGLAERLGWRMQKEDEAVVEQFCEESGIRRNVLKVWMHNNKHTLGKKP